MNTEPLQPKPAFDIPLPVWSQWTLVGVAGAATLAVVIYMIYVEVKRRQRSE
jgi:hypothetical protein